MPTVSALSLGAYCLRKLHYRQECGWDDGADQTTTRSLASKYPALLSGRVPRNRLGSNPDSVAAALRGSRDRLPAVWPTLRDTAPSRNRLQGQDCSGIAARVIDTDPPVPTFLSSGQPPAEGVWHRHSVRAVGLAKALAWERHCTVARTLVEYPRFGVIRSVPLTGRRRAAFRRVLRAVKTMDDPPSRTDDTAKCESCEFRDRCGVRSRSLRSRLT